MSIKSNLLLLKPKVAAPVICSHYIRVTVAFESLHGLIEKRLTQW